MKTIIVFTSMTGNTELMAASIAGELTRLGEEVIVKDVFEVDAQELSLFERILIGSYTWGDGDLPDEMLDFYQELKCTDLTGKCAAVFGAGDSSYEHFARAVDIFEETLERQGCQIVAGGLKIDGDLDEEIKAKCKVFTRTLSGVLGYLDNH